MFDSVDFKTMGLAVKTITFTPNPQTVAYMAMHQDYSEFFVADEMLPSGMPLNDNPDVVDPVNSPRVLDESNAGLRVIQRCLKKRHFGPLEHPQIVVAVQGFPHTTMQQLRTHRTGISFDVQSGRYTGKRLIEAYDKLKDEEDLKKCLDIIREVFFIRPEGVYQDRFSKGINWELNGYWEFTLVSFYTRLLTEYYIFVHHEGMPPEMARDLFVTHNVRQNFVLSLNLRSALHLLEMRFKKDAELECQWFSHLLYLELVKWAPEILSWWLQERGLKNMIAP